MGSPLMPVNAAVRRTLGCAAVLVAATGVSTPFALGGPGYIYWGSTASGSTIGRAMLDGSNPDPNWISGLTCGCTPSYGNGYVWWSSSSGQSVVRANPLTAAVTNPFISTGQATAALRTGNAGYLSWVTTSAVGWFVHDLSTGLTTGPIAASTDGVTRVGSFLYGTQTTTGPARFRIMRLDSTGANAVPLTSWIAYSGRSSKIAVEGAYVYFSYTPSAGAQALIGRARTDGSAADAAFITQPAGEQPGWVDATPSALYWLAVVAGTSERRIYRAASDGTGMSYLLSPPGTTASGLAVEPASSPSPPPTPQPAPSPVPDLGQAAEIAPVTAGRPAAVPAARSLAAAGPVRIDRAPGVRGSARRIRMALTIPDAGRVTLFLERPDGNRLPLLRGSAVGRRAFTVPRYAPIAVIGSAGATLRLALLIGGDGVPDGTVLRVVRREDSGLIRQSIPVR